MLATKLPGIFRMWRRARLLVAVAASVGGGEAAIVLRAAARGNQTSGAPTKSAQLMAVGDQCKCKFSGLCSCAAAVKFMDCISDACASGACDCEHHHFLNTCLSMSATCPQEDLHCSMEKVVCMHEPIVGNATEKELLAQLRDLRKRRCRLEKASKAGYVNAESRLQELKPIIQGKLDQLKAKGAQQPVYMGCGPLPKNGSSLSWRGGLQATPAVEFEAPPPVPPLPAPAAQLQAGAPEKRSGGKDDAATGWIFSDGRRFRIMAAHVALYVVVTLLVAAMYDLVRLKAKFPQGAEPGDPDEGFQYGLFSCFQDPKLSALAFCCPAIRWADTMDKADENGRETFLTYWHAVLLMTLLIAIHLYVGVAAIHPFVGWLFYVGAVVVGAYFRQKLRRNFDFPAGSLHIYTTDFLGWFFCPCCSIVQEARQVEAPLVEASL